MPTFGMGSGIRRGPRRAGAFGAFAGTGPGAGCGGTVGEDADLTVSLYQKRLKYDYQ